MKSTLAAIVRHLLTAAGGYLVAKGIELDSASIEAISGGVAAVGAILWSLYEKRGRSA